MATRTPLRASSSSSTTRAVSDEMDGYVQSHHHGGRDPFFFSFSFLLTGCVGNIDGKAAYLCAGHDVRRLDHVQQPAILRLVD